MRAPKHFRTVIRRSLTRCCTQSFFTAKYLVRLFTPSRLIIPFATELSVSTTALTS